MPVVETKGSASSQGFGEFAKSGGAANYIEDVFSTYLYTGNAPSTQTITNGIDLSTKGGLVWLKYRDGTQDHVLIDTVRGNNKELFSNQTYANYTETTPNISSFNTNGFGLQQGSGYFMNTNGANYASWTFREQAKFFDVVTYTGNGVAGRTVAHNLGSVPGSIFVKVTSAAGNWNVYHRSLGATKYILLNSTSAELTDSTRWNDTAPTSTEFTLGTAGNVNANGLTYVAYLFAHDASGFGLTGTDNVISCGSFTTDGSGLASVNLGYEPQWVLFKASSTSSNWYILDNMRGLDAVYDQGNALAPNLSNAEFTFDPLSINATGFNVSTAPNPNTTYIYIAIRRGPMKTPTSGTSVFSPQLEGGTAGTKITTGFPIDWQLIKARSSAQTTYGITRLTGVSSTTTEAAGNLLQTASTAAELADSTATRYWDNTGFQVPSGFAGGSSTYYITENFRRAPSFFDVVCYTGTGSARTVTHNLGVTPELMIVKNRSVVSGSGNWSVYSSTGTATKNLFLNLTNAFATNSSYWNNTSPTSTVFTVGTNGGVNASADTYVAYLFASCPGVSKVGSYTGTGGTQTISCGFAARFVLIKRTDSTGDWWVWDTARGMVAGTDPRIALNSATAETNANWVYTDASGFQIVTTDATVNASGGSYIYLAIA